MSSYVVRDEYIYKIRKLRVICIGAGLTGIAAVHKLQSKHSDLEIDFQIYEKNWDVGGTWLENRYPGCACDVPAHSVFLPSDVINCSIRIRGREIQSGVDFMLVGRRFGLIIRDWRINGE